MAILKDGELYLYGYVGGSFWDDGFTSSEVVAALSEIGRNANLKVHVNSGGGNAFEGAAIHSLFSSHKGNVEIIVEGIAASAASAIAMSGDTVTMTAGSIMMVHDPSTVTFGTAKDHTKTISALNALGTSMAGLYSDKTGKTEAESRADMEEEIWLTPDQAVSQGYADNQAGDEEFEPTAFDYRVYAHAPKNLQSMAAKENWSMTASAKAETSASSKSTKKETVSMTGKPTADEITAAEMSGAEKAQTRIKLIMQSEEATGREAQAEMLAYETQMCAEDAIKVLSKAPQKTTNDLSEAEQYTNDRVAASNLAMPMRSQTNISKIDANEIYKNRSEAE